MSRDLGYPRARVAALDIAFALDLIGAPAGPHSTWRPRYRCTCYTWPHATGQYDDDDLCPPPACGLLRGINIRGEFVFARPGSFRRK